MILHLKAFIIRHFNSLVILAAVLAMALGGIISWANLGIFAAGWLFCLTVTTWKNF